MSQPTADPIHIVNRLHHAWNTHDLEAVVACFHSDYQSIHPCHPDRNFKGHSLLRVSWGAIFESVPDLRADLCRWAVTGNTAWTEWRWEGKLIDGQPYGAAGIIIFEIEAEHIRRAHLYSETLQSAGLDWDEMLTGLLERIYKGPALS